jgi:nucleotide-binding universal stress UspA family protein
MNNRNPPLWRRSIRFTRTPSPPTLDVRLLQIGRRFARVFSGNLHIFHPYMPLGSVQTPPMPAAAALIATPPELEQLHQQQVARAVDRLAQWARIPKAHRHLRLGHVAPELSALANPLRAGVVVMSAVSRSGIQRLLIGNTTESVLDDMPMRCAGGETSRIQKQGLAEQEQGIDAPARRCQAFGHIRLLVDVELVCTPSPPVPGLRDTAAPPRFGSARTYRFMRSNRASAPLRLFRHIRKAVPGNAAHFRVLRRLCFVSLTEYSFEVSRYRIEIGPPAPSKRFRFRPFWIRS